MFWLSLNNKMMKTIKSVRQFTTKNNSETTFDLLSQMQKDMKKIKTDKAFPETASPFVTQ